MDSYLQRAYTAQRKSLEAMARDLGVASVHGPPPSKMETPTLRRWVIKRLIDNHSQFDSAERRNG